MVQKPIKWYKNLATRKGRLEAEAFLVESLSNGTRILPQEKGGLKPKHFLLKGTGPSGI